MLLKYCTHEVTIISGEMSGAHLCSRPRLPCTLLT
ncbi:hypothetical protein E2C01_084500 [Portunus trituberculatus]|uniref:Uncharacterized protein n=1 Tax=Portunus trituberculatus TaxID=210409 RepID=A0A5B7J7Q0_PORTR|nr:hypothetical protein [Portunus trituberculatus]